VDQDINNSQNEQLWTLLADPANDAHLYADNLQTLVNDFPQSGILQALLAHASDEKNLRRASVYFNARSLYKLINSPSAFTSVPDEKIIIQTGIQANGHYQKKALQESGEVLSTEKDENIDHNIDDIHIEDNAIAETGPEIAADAIDHEPKVEHDENLPSNMPVTDTHHLIEATPGIEENAAVEESIELINDVTAKDNKLAGLIDEDHVESSTDALVVSHNAELPEQEAEKGISDETFDEIVGIEHINIEPEANQSVTVAIHEEDVIVQEEKAEPSAIINEEEVEEVKVQDEKAEPAPIINEEDVRRENEKAEPLSFINDEEEKLIKDNIVSSDFFMFDRAFGENKPEQPDNNPVEQIDHKPVEPVENKPLELPSNTTETTEVKSSVTDDTNHKDVSKYNDEQMPYTFMWWLDKTRKEHAGTYQPYVKPEPVNLNDKPKKAADELQQQYFENIFHITSVDELDKSTAPPVVPFDIKRKEHKIIERFIKEEPQIKPQSSDKLDNENKAKKSSEDRDELVTETLAAIYTDQMLYHKAIASYKKLILKFPEKSRYFAGKIEQLEKKTS